MTNNVLQFPVLAAPLPPPPAPRAMLQPSIYGRGVRNFVFAGPVDDYHAPGAVVSKQDTRCAVDAAWLVERVLGAPKRKPQVAFPAVRAARDRALAWGAHAGLAAFQQEGAAFLAERDYALLVDEMGCVEGDAVIHAHRAGRGFKISLRDLYRRTRGMIGSWDPTIATRVRVNANGDLRQHPIMEVLYKGIRPVMRLLLKSGKSLRLTADHEVALSDGTTYRRVDRLDAGTKVLSNGAAACHNCRSTENVVTSRHTKFPGYCRKCIYRHCRHNPIKNGKFIDKDGYVRVTAGHRDHPRHTTGGVYEHILVMEEHLGRYLTEDEEVHHKDRVRHNNALDNLELLAGVEHHAKHGREGGFRSLHGGSTINGGVVEFVPVVDEVVSVDPAGETDVYDIVCADPYRNFVANGVIVHNCGKTPQTLIAAEARLSLAAIPAPNTPAALILCPALAKRHWQAEIKKWLGYDSTILDTLTPDPEQLCTRYIIANYDILYGGRRKDAAGVIHDVDKLPGWADMLSGRFLITIADEAHMLKGRSSRRNAAVKKVCKGVPVVWGLTGTPMPNYVRDLWALVDLISDGLWGYSYWKWAETYAGAAKGQYGMIDTGASHLDELQGRLAFFMLGRTAKSVQLELPEKRREVYRVDVTMTAPTVHEGHDALSKSNAVASALRKTAYAKRSAVVGAAVEAIQAKQKVVVFVYMREQAEAVAKEIKKQVDCTVHAVSGDVSPNGRYEQAQAFREAQSPCCFVATIDAMGVALSLVGANLMIFGDVVPEPWKLLQAEKRGHRFDSPCRLLVRYVIATGTIDEGIVESVLAKIPVIEQTLGHQDDANELTTMLGGKTDVEIVDSLFAKLQSWKGESDG